MKTEERLITELSSLISLAIAAVVAFIGCLQWRTARLQWKTTHNRAVFDQFERRYTIYKALREVVGAVTRSGSADQKLFVNAAEAFEEAQFLFGDDIVAYLKQFTNDLLLLESLVTEQSEANGPGLANNLKEQDRLKDRIQEFRTTGKALFSVYIRFDQKIR
jgi:hypothetical protein